VADNGSTDGTAESVRRFFPEVRLVEMGANLGFAAACNRGAEAGTNEVIVLLNNDVEPRPDFLERLIEPLAADERVGSVAALLVRPNGRVIDSVGLTADLTLAGFPRLEGMRIETARSPRPLLVGPSGGAAAYRREAWEHVGGLDESVLLYLEDLDFALRLRNHGWIAAAAPEAVGVHLGGATVGRRSAWQRRQMGFSRGYFLRRYGVLRSRAAPRALATEVIVVMGDFVYSRDFAALRGRLAGWRAGSGCRRHRSPKDALEREIGFIESLRRRRRSYAAT
jgi:N-acetylglucosaminyl-diphospho-decaprenol L-rhamnosyltransferase